MTPGEEIDNAEGENGMRGFRIWSNYWKKYATEAELYMDGSADAVFDDADGVPHHENTDLVVEFETGLKDKNGREIYENCELDGRYRVEYIAPKFVGKDMIKGDIIELYDNKFTITKEHCEISQNSERDTN